MTYLYVMISYARNANEYQMTADTEGTRKFPTMSDCLNYGAERGWRIVSFQQLGRATDNLIWEVVFENEHDN